MNLFWRKEMLKRILVYAVITVLIVCVIGSFFLPTLARARCCARRGGYRLFIPSAPKYAVSLEESEAVLPDTDDIYRYGYRTENYSVIVENSFQPAESNPLSTFSIDVDTASYANIRRFLERGSVIPPKGAVRLEEIINYFSYEYPEPGKENPFSVVTELGQCPWNTDHSLLHIGIQGRNISTDDLTPSNLVFLIDVSGSMDDPYKLPLLKDAFNLMVDSLKERDRIAIVVYAGADRVVLDSTPGTRKSEIKKAIRKLDAGGSTAGGAGIIRAYDIASENLIKNGNNRVILATDGDFNVGISSESGLVELIEEQREKGIFLSVLGFGTGNYQDSKMELLADKGNGNYFYIDTLNEAKKVLVRELTGTLLTIAKDVKIQIEFNPDQVKGYRLIGYENRVLEDTDFNDDTKDAGELGAGHSVTALYEIIPAGSGEKLPGTDPLKYQKPAEHSGKGSDETATVKLRYKKPDEDTSILMSYTVDNAVTDLDDSSDNFRWSAAAAGFGLVLRNSEYKGRLDYKMVAELAESAKGDDVYGYREEFLSLVHIAETLAE